MAAKTWTILFKLCVERKGEGYSFCTCFLSFVFISLQKFAGRLWQWCNCKLLKTKMIQLYLQTWNALKEMIRVREYAHSLHKLIRKASGEIKQSQCCIWQNTSKLQAMTWNVGVYSEKVWGVVFYQGEGKREASCFVCFACVCTSEYLKAVHVHTCCDCMAVTF